MLMWLGHVAFKCFVGSWAVAGCQGVHETGPQRVGFLLNGGQPRLFDGEAGGGMEKHNEGGCTG